MTWNMLIETRSSRNYDVIRYLLYYDMLYYVEGSYDHQTSNLFTIIAIQIHYRQIEKKRKDKSDKENNVHGNIQKNIHTY